MFFIERLVLYPYTPFIFFGHLFHIILPAIIKITGISKLHININHQNHIYYNPFFKFQFI